MIKGILNCILLLFIAFGLSAQQNVGFNHLTGTANVSIPLYQVGNVPISLNYSARGIQPKQVAGLVGLGWNLSAGGSITRQVNGLADDSVEKGWLYNNVGNTIESFEVTTDDPTCSNEDDNWNHIALGKIYSKTDAEPDLFYINTPFISGNFMFDKDGNIQAQPYQDLDIQYTATSGPISSFTIIDDSGVKYQFDVVDNAYRNVKFENDDIFFSELRDNHSSFDLINEVWHLSKITTPNGQFVNYEYNALGSGGINEKSYNEGLAKNYMYEGSSSNSFGMSYAAHKTNILNGVSDHLP